MVMNQQNGLINLCLIINIYSGLIKLQVEVIQILHNILYYLGLLFINNKVIKNLINILEILLRIWECKGIKIELSALLKSIIIRIKKNFLINIILEHIIAHLPSFLTFLSELDLSVQELSHFKVVNLMLLIEYSIRTMVLGTMRFLHPQI